jgi:hypothetical protein
MVDLRLVWHYLYLGLPFGSYHDHIGQGLQFMGAQTYPLQEAVESGQTGGGGLDVTSLSTDEKKEMEMAISLVAELTHCVSCASHSVVFVGFVLS